MLGCLGAVKAIDFGLSAFFSQGLSDPECTGLKLQGTPWFIPPEALTDVFCPAGDIWGAGGPPYSHEDYSVSTLKIITLKLIQPLR